jgi:hypothetical protein
MGFCPYLRHAHESGGGGPSPLILARSPHSEMGTDTTLFSTDLRLEEQKKKHPQSILRDKLDGRVNQRKIESLEMYSYLRLGGGSGEDDEGWSRLLCAPVTGESASAGGWSSAESALGDSVPVLQ